MKQFKEYPATHSMSTAWYCVDEDGNVGIFDIEDNGPVPVGGYKQNCVNEVFWDDFSAEDVDFFRSLNLSEEQVRSMLEPCEFKDIWTQDELGLANYSWMNVIIKIDMSKIDVFKQAVSLIEKDNVSPICLSKDLGLFYVDLYFYENRKAVDHLEKNHVVLAKYKAPDFSSPSGNDNDDEKEQIEKSIQKFPLFIYHQDYAVSRYPAIRVRNPKYPMRIEQLPKKVQDSIKKIPVRFKECELVQLAELMPVFGLWSKKYVYNKRIWWQLASSDGGKLFYNETTYSIIHGDEMDKLIAAGKAEEWDYHKHYELEEEEDG